MEERRYLRTDGGWICQIQEGRAGKERTSTNDAKILVESMAYENTPQVHQQPQLFVRDFQRYKSVPRGCRLQVALCYTLINFHD